MKQYKNSKPSSTKLTPIQVSLNNNEGFVYQNLLAKRKKVESKQKIGDLIRTADWKKTISKSDTNNWSYDIYKFLEVINETIPRYCIDSLPRRYKGALLKKTKFTVKQKKDAVKKLNLFEKSID